MIQSHQHPAPATLSKTSSLSARRSLRFWTRTPKGLGIHEHRSHFSRSPLMWANPTQKSCRSSRTSTAAAAELDDARKPASRGGEPASASGASRRCCARKDPTRTAGNRNPETLRRGATRVCRGFGFARGPSQGNNRRPKSSRTTALRRAPMHTLTEDLEQSRHLGTRAYRVRYSV